MRPNLERIPGYGDARAEVILRRAHDGVTAELMNTLGRRDVLALGRYGSRQPAIALRVRSLEILRGALLAIGIAQVRHESDPRDLMIGLALHHVVAQQLGQSPSAIFDDVAARLPDGPVAALFREFGARQDITLKAFGWQLVLTANGPEDALGRGAAKANY
jgi:hypothetical protein